MPIQRLRATLEKYNAYCMHNNDRKGFQLLSYDSEPVISITISRCQFVQEYDLLKYAPPPPVNSFSLTRRI